MGGYTPVETADGIGFIETNYEKYNPEKNLAKLLLSFSVYISGDKYTLGNITIGQKISSIWLSADNDKGVESAISKATGCASLSTYLKSEFHPKSGVQMLLLYLAEFKDQESLKVLIERTNTTSPTTFSRLSFVEGNIFCVVIQRAVMSGVEDFETNETLKRFESPIRELIKKH